MFNRIHDLRAHPPCQAEFSLYEELEKLSTAWESLDKQLGNKVFDLSVMEERLQKSLVEVSG